MFDKLMVSRSWWGEGTKSFFEESFVVKGSKRAESRKGTAIANTYAFAGTSLFPTLASVHFRYKDDHHSHLPSVTYCTNTFPTFHGGSNSEFRLPTPPRNAR